MTRELVTNRERNEHHRQFYWSKGENLLENARVIRIHRYSQPSAIELAMYELQMIIGLNIGQRSVSIYMRDQPVLSAARSCSIVGDWIVQQVKPI